MSVSDAFGRDTLRGDGWRGGGGVGLGRELGEDGGGGCCATLVSLSAVGRDPVASFHTLSRSRASITPALIDQWMALSLPPSC